MATNDQWQQRAQQLLVELMGLPGRSGQERSVAEFIIRRLRKAGVPATAIRTDQAHRRSPLGGEVGNLICKLPGSVRGPRRLLMAHLDTVPLCAGAVPVVRDGWIVPADKATALGADDRAGAAVLLLAVEQILRRRLPHPPLTFLWTVQEEVGLYGARYGQLGLLGKPRLAFNFDGGPAEKVTIGATGAYRIRIEVHGLASHAGVAPEAGVSAAVIAALAIAQLHRQGWHGLVAKGRRRGTSNIGMVHGGEATNVVTPDLELRAEARSHDPAFRRRIVKAIEHAFRHAARTVRNSAGMCGTVTLHSTLQYESFRLADDDPSVHAAESAIRGENGNPYRALSNGGLDANWLTARGIPTVSLGCGQMNPHTTDERLDLLQFHMACRVAVRLATVSGGTC